MGKRLFATKTSTLRDKLTALCCGALYNNSVTDEIKNKLATASELHTLQLAATSLAKNLGVTYTKAANNNTGALAMLKQKLKQFYQSWDTTTIRENTKTTYIHPFYKPRTTEKITDNETITNTTQNTEQGGLNSYFVNDLRGDDTKIRLTNDQNGKHGKTLQKYVEDTAKQWREAKQKLKTAAEDELTRLKKTCHTVAQYETWFDHQAQTDLSKLDEKKLKKLQTIATQNWGRYTKYLNDNENSKYLQNNYKTTDTYKNTQSNFNQLTQHKRK